uniref:Uncharacterized protein n=1 Tax=Romanomermis culicivorax TaxID=13658 RepID=A0A915JE24_ROMCU
MKLDEIFVVPMMLLSMAVLVYALNFSPSNELGNSDNKWILVTIVGVAFSICGIAITFLCTCCKDALQPK